MLWLPLILIVTLGPLRPMKGLMIALQYHHKAEEGRSAAADDLERTATRRHSAAARSWLGLLVPALLAFIVLIGLGTWQIERKAWKEGADRVADRAARGAAAALPAPEDWPHLDAARRRIPPRHIQRAIRSCGEALVFASASAFRPDVSGPGYWVFTPARLADGSIVIVNRGFVPDGRQDAKSRSDGRFRGPVDIVGAMRWPDARHWFTPNDDPAHNLWFSRDPQAIAAAKGLGAVAPFYVEQETPVPPGGLPQPGKLVVEPAR